MNKKSIDKHRKVIDWFLINPEKGVWVQTIYETGWRLSKNPAFDVRYKYVINDAYTKFRKAFEDGLQIEYSYCEELNVYVGKLKWKKLHLEDFSSIYLNDRQYRIKPKFKVGDWVKENSNGDIKQVTCGITENFETRMEMYERLTTLWKPEIAEYCFFYNSKDKSARLAQFKQIASGRGREGKYKDMQGNYFTYCEPFTSRLPNNLEVR